MRVHTDTHNHTQIHTYTHTTHRHLNTEASGKFVKNAVGYVRWGTCWPWSTRHLFPLWHLAQSKQHAHTRTVCNKGTHNISPASFVLVWTMLDL